MTAAELIAELQKLDPETIVFALHNLSYRTPQIVRLASTEYGLFPGEKKVAILADVRG
jgi:hypothetical protein